MPELQDHPLLVGLSMEVEVDVGVQESQTLTQAPRSETALTTQAFEAAHGDVDILINTIIQENLAS
jgi:membrane fusion protein, multidrug efflux system